MTTTTTTTPVTTVAAPARGVALLAVLFALTLLMLLALPFAVSMGVGADAAMRDVEQAAVEQASASARDLLLADAALSNSSFDPTRTYDSLAEWPDHVELPKAFAPLTEGGRVLLGGSVWDLQRMIALDSVSPLVLTNLLGNTTRLAEVLAPDAQDISLDDATNLPEQGYVWIAHEVVRYGSKDGNKLKDLQRSQFVAEGFLKQEAAVTDQTLVLDYRCVMAVAWPFLGRSGDLSVRKPYAAVAEVNEISERGIGAFTQSEIDRFVQSLSTETMAQTAATWGRPERVFDSLLANESRSLRVKSALHIGAGSTVRLSNIKTGAVEHGLVMMVLTEQGQRDLILPSVFRLELLQPVRQAFPAVDTVIEPLVPAPVNVNTASAPVLMAMLENLRRAADVKVHQDDGREKPAPPRPLSRQDARACVDFVLTARQGDEGVPGQGPFTGWEDFVTRVMQPRFEVSNDSTKRVWLDVYRNLQTGRDSTIEMGTVPSCFESGPWVGYRAAASRSRSTVALGIAARHERTGLAAAVPGFQLLRDWPTQIQLEEAFRLDRRAPGWVTTPVNLGALPPSDLGNDPAPRHFPNVVAIAYPGLGFGAARYAGKDEADAGIVPGTAVSVPGRWASEVRAHESFAQTLDPRGHDVQKDGPYLISNTGPRGGGAPAAAASGRHDRISFPFSNQYGFVDRWGTSFWLEPQTLAAVTLFDHGDGDPNRNRMSVQGKDGNLLFEVIDEAGLDPDPSQSPAGVERTASQWSVPLADIGLPANTPVHLAISAYGSRPSELALHVDGMPRGKGKFMTYLAASLKAFDPALANNSSVFPPLPGNERYFDMQVESTEGFPKVGVLRVGTELFEYTGISGNSFQCQWKDSIGGRGARQVSREFRPDIPVDANGEPTVDINSLQNQGINLDVYPEHPVGALVELYGYAALLSEDSPMMTGTTRLDGAIGGFAVARGFLSNPRDIGLAVPGVGTLPIGRGLDENWTGDLELADPLPGRTYKPNDAQPAIAEAFSLSGGYALLMQEYIPWQSNIPGTLSVGAVTGGIEVIRYTSRQGTKLRGVQRNQVVPGDDSKIDRDTYDGTARKFVCDWIDRPWDPLNPQVWYDDLPGLILWVVPITITVQSTSNLWDPQATRLTEWIQLYPDGGDVNDTEWVRYDAIMNGKQLARGNRQAWERTYRQLTRATAAVTIQLGPLGPTGGGSRSVAPPWNPVTQSAGFIGYTPKLEADFPQIRAARRDLAFRGDMMRDFFQGRFGTSSHAHTNSVVMQCQRLQLSWGNFGAFTGRVGRTDRVAIVQGSTASGTDRPAVEWHTVNWSARRFDADNLARNQTPDERLGPWPFQLVAFTDGVQGAFIGPPPGAVTLEPRMYDRVVKFPSGELPAAFCENVHVGGGVGNQSPMQGFVDEIDILQHERDDLVLDESCTAAANTFRVNIHLTYNSTGPLWYANDLSAEYPEGGGLLMIDGEIVAYQQRADGAFTVAQNGRGLLGTEARDHDKGARVHFLSHRPAAILVSGVGSRDNELALQALGAVPGRGGTVRIGNELLHYSWVRRAGDAATLVMPRWYPPGEGDTTTGSRGLFRGRFGSVPYSASSGEAVITWPCRYPDRHVELSDDPELAYFQFTVTEAPSFYRSLTWSEETTDPRVDVVCLVRTDSKAPWNADPTKTPGLWQFTRGAGDDAASLIGAQGSRLEIRFAVVYKPGVLDLIGSTAHGWKTTVRVEKVVVEYDGQGRIIDEVVTAR